MKINKGLTIILGLAMIFIVSSPAMAGHGRGWKNGDGMGYRGCPMGRNGGHGMMGFGFLRDADLTDDQMQKIVEIAKGFAPELKAQKEAVWTARQGMMELMMADGTDEAAVRKAYGAAAAAEEAMTVLRFKMMSEIKTVLTKEQLAQAKEKMTLRHERMRDRSDRRWGDFERQMDALIQ
ncbi:Spy/CpxP family protein refolding chaperone [Desulfococcus sp.]|uniref:Spy/CpxP family protein refolding chaperone n=1 Tax=Desulfococcus sp. TaxID=2025834 RepID=UPI003593297A